MAEREGTKERVKQSTPLAGWLSFFSSQLIIRIKQIKTSFLKTLGGANNLLQKTAKPASSAVKKSRRDSPSG